jgi:hypothetical protein
MKPVRLFHATILCLLAGVVMAETPPFAQRAFPIERAIQNADTAIGYPAGRPNTLELLRAVYVIEPLKGDQFEGALLPDEVVRQLSGKTFWVLRYRRYPIAVGGGMSVFLNGLTGEAVYVARSK